MTDVEALSMQAMEIITYAGMAKSNYITALKLAKQGKEEEAKLALKEGDPMVSKAHTYHFDLMQKESESREPQVSLMIMHAEDQLMSCETIKILITELIELYERN